LSYKFALLIGRLKIAFHRFRVPKADKGQRIHYSKLGGKMKQYTAEELEDMDVGEIQDYFEKLHKENRTSY